jgi:predicted transposase/invertase (TIGR01784 family)
MRRDSIFYALFQQAPTLLFELLESPPLNAEEYRFDSVAVKEPKFEIDGVFLPPETETPGIVFFCEVQFQKDEQLYERLFGESFLYFYRNRARFSDWQAVVIYPSPAIEQQEIQPFEDLLNGNRVHRIYLSELGEIENLPLGIALMVLTTIVENQAVEVARNLLDRVRQTELSVQNRHGIMEMITTILVYKFTNLGRREIEQMLGTALQQTRFYQEAKEEGREEGRGEGQRSLILLLLNQKVGTLSDETIAQISTLSPEQLESLAISLLNFSDMRDLTEWLNN